MLAEIANNEFITHMFIMEYIYGKAAERKTLSERCATVKLKLYELNDMIDYICIFEIRIFISEFHTGGVTFQIYRKIVSFSRRAFAFVNFTNDLIHF